MKVEVEKKVTIVLESEDDFRRMDAILISARGVYREISGQDMHEFLDVIEQIKTAVDYK